MGIKWIQLPGISFGSKGRGRIHAAFEEFYNRHRKDIFKDINFLFITGDIGGENDEEQKVELIKHFQQVLNINADKTFIVPGEKDIEYSDRRNVSVDTYFSKGYSDEYIEEINNQDTSFYEMCKKVSNKVSTKVLSVYSENKVNIICINTALLSKKDVNTVSLAIDFDENIEGLNDENPTIVLAHHNFNCLEQNAFKELELYLKDIDARIYLCGHSEVSNFHMITNYKMTQGLWELNCGNGNIDKNCLFFSVGELADDGMNGKIWVYKWDKTGKNWLGDIGLYSRQKPDDKNFLEFEVKDLNYDNPLDIAIENYLSNIELHCKSNCLNGVLSNGMLISLDKLRIKTKFVENTDLAKDINQESSKSEVASVLLKKSIEKNINYYIGAELGGGKTTLLQHLTLIAIEKWRVNKEELFPIWIQCRYIRNPRAEIDSIIQGCIKSQLNETDICIEEFIDFIEERIKKNLALIVIDGLDEIVVDSERTAFFNNLQKFIGLNSLQHIFVSSRIAGFKDIYNTVICFERLEISLLDRTEICGFCAKWFEETKSSKRTKDKLIKDITEDAKIFRLAKNPMLLTMMLMIYQQRGMQLPQKRSVLYHAAIEMFVDKWNSVWHSKWNPEETIIKLSYIAFCMTFMKRKNSPIGQIELKERLLAVMGMSDVFIDNLDKESKLKDISEFLDRSEKSSGLLVESGSKKNKENLREPLYIFRHQIFQEYLAAYALVHGYYPNVRNVNPLKILKEYGVLEKEINEETVILTAELSDHHAVKIVDEIYDQIDTIEKSCVYPDKKFRIQKYYKHLIIQMIVAGVRVTSTRRLEIYNLVFKRISAKQIDDIKALLDSRFKDEFVEFIESQREEVLTGNVSYDLQIMYEFYKDKLTGKKIYSLYRKLTKSKNLEEQRKAMMYADVAIMLSPYGYDFFEDLGSNNIQKLLDDFIKKISSEDIIVAASAAAALTCFTCVRGTDEIRNRLIKYPHLIESILKVGKETDLIYVLVLCQCFDILDEKVNRIYINLDIEIKNWVCECFEKARGHSQKMGSFWACALCGKWTFDDFNMHYNDLMERNIVPISEKDEFIELRQKFVKYKNWK